MTTAKIFQHGGSQAVRLPKAFRFDAKEVLIEKHGQEVVLRPIGQPTLKTFKQIAKHLAEQFPDASEFPEPPPRPKKHERSIVEF
ncbi:MAG: AbrB/MazE/SpoVT family DNA-binding domain-containing protein [Verrucomicrobiaceae bacterium]|nr:AbrB/MazE/SpoVT family DNA-binding domain-containing protein [Verrucomicrobiaceae bacterium]